MIKQLHYWLYRRKHGYPSKDEIWELLPVISMRCTTRIANVSQTWAFSGPYIGMKELGDVFHSSSERVRQILNKARRQALKRVAHDN